MKDITAGHAVTTINNVIEARDIAKQKAFDSLGRYKFEMFGYHASAWVKYNQLLPVELKQGNPFSALVNVARYENNTPPEQQQPSYNRPEGEDMKDQ